ncbi:uncharacterized protein LOC133730369 [Rosa rugosa]|uniref:uncharacterized protein LOC133730369 n=1 Tax=Rosa rugosa TaxID=74645 RepID=UPI002B4006EC|nr:uncharacterized protein LOC133730369 [Rosa rugosa]
MYRQFQSRELLLRKSGGGVFIKEHARLIITDDLQVTPPLIGANSPLFTKFGVMVGNCTASQMTFNVGLRKVWNLILRSVVSKSPLTDTLLKHCPVAGLSINNFIQEKWKNTQTDAQNKEENILVKLMISKSMKMVCYAEAGIDFVSLLQSFLIVPFGYIVKRMQDGSLEGCIDQLCKSVQDLDDQYGKSIKKPQGNASDTQT